MAAVISTSPIESLVTGKHLVLEDADWSLYQQVSQAAGDRPLQITYHKGRLEIMAPLQSHESDGWHISRLIEMMTFELDIPLDGYGSSTFARHDADCGLEPDECYYVQNADRVSGMKQFDSKVHPPPDLAIEIDVTSRSVRREPIYAALGVPELWRYRHSKLTVLLLQSSGSYQPSPASRAFPFLPMDRFEAFIHRMESEPKQSVLRDFQRWVRTLRPSS